MALDSCHDGSIGGNGLHRCSNIAPQCHVRLTCALRATKRLPNGDKVCSFHFNRPRPEPLNTYLLGQTFGRPSKEQLTRQAVAKGETTICVWLRQRVRLRRQSITLGKVLLAGVLASSFLLNEFPRPAKLNSRPHLYVESANQKPTRF